MSEPPAGPTPPRSIRVSDALWSAARTKAIHEGKTVTEVLIAALERYTEPPGSAERVSKRDAFRVLTGAGFDADQVRKLIYPPKEA